jgi:hypothetical protein
MWEFLIPLFTSLFSKSGTMTGAGAKLPTDVQSPYYQPYNYGGRVAQGYGNMWSNLIGSLTTSQPQVRAQSSPFSQQPQQGQQFQYPMGVPSAGGGSQNSLFYQAILPLLLKSLR